MRIQHNIAALNSYRNLSGNNNSVSKNLEKLSSGYRINRAGDDAAGLAISEKMRAQITGLDTAQKNAQDGISLVQTAEGNLQEVHDMLNRMTELATQSANGTYDDTTDRANLQKEFDALSTEINRISKSANFNGIKLLDGSLAANEAATITDGVVSTTAGVTLTQGQNGAGTKGTYTIDLGGGLFGTGDTLTVNGTDLTNTDFGAAEVFNFMNAGDTVPANGAITGSTSEEQAKSLAEAMGKRAAINGNFDISVDGTKVILTSKEEGTGKSTITQATHSNATGARGDVDGTVSKTAAAGTAAVANSWTGLFGSGTAGTSGDTGYNVEVGDVVRFGFKDAIGNDLFADVKITQDMIDNNHDIRALTEAITDQLKDTRFTDVEGTAVDESNIMVKDMFTLEANKAAAADADGSIKVTGVAGTIGTMGSVKILRDGVSINGAGLDPAAGSTATAAQVQVYALNNTGGVNYSKGDIFSINGTLSDGSVFAINMEAGKDFTIGADYDTTMANIAKALNGTGDGTGVKVTVGAGDTAKTVTSDQLFGATKREFKAVESTGGSLVITSAIGTTAGKGKAGAITGISLTTVTNADAALEKAPAVAQGYATSTIGVDKKIQYGTAVSIGDYTFEVVKDARDVTSRNNTAVVIADLENKSAAEIAKAIADTAANTDAFAARKDVSDDGTDTGVIDDTKAATAKAAGASYAISADNGVISITTLDKGSAIAAPKLSTPYGDNIGTKSIKFDGAKLDYGDSLEINGKTYEFVKKPTDAKEGNIGITVDDIHTATSKQIGDALADVARDVKAAVAEDGTVTIQSNADADGKVQTPTIVFEGEGLRLQVGETNEDFQKVNVKIRAVNTETLGLDQINIANQDDAGRAIEVIKNAINSVSSTRGDLGALQNRLDHTINNLGVTSENMTAAESRIRDVDMAKEMMDYTKNNILVQAAQAMLAQANQVPQGVLQLLQ